MTTDVDQKKTEEVSAAEAKLAALQAELEKMKAAAAAASAKASEPEKAAEKPEKKKAKKDKAEKKAKAEKPEKKAKPEKKEKVPVSDQKCTFKGCDRPVLAAGLCSTHYRQQNRGRELTPIRPYGELVRLATVLRVRPEIVEQINARVKSGAAPSVYEACRQAVELGVEVWVKQAAKAEAKAAAKK